MRASQSFIHTLYEHPADAEVPSHRLLAQAGYIQKVAAGIYSYAPAMVRVLHRISNIIREEMNRAGAQEVLLPALQPRSIWDESGRWERYTADGLLFHFKDRKESELCLGPTHEEAVTKLVTASISSYKQLPFNLYQIQTKFRDEIRPRFGLMRGREFIMKDAYSFDADIEGMDRSYVIMREAYRRIFDRCGLSYAIVEADSGAIGGSGSEEFVVTADTGEDVFLIEEMSGYAANQERAISYLEPSSSLTDTHELALEKVSTPNVKTIEELTSFFPKLAADRLLKAVLYEAIYADTTEAVIVFIRGDREVNEVKASNALKAFTIRPLTEQEAINKYKLTPGFLGPIGLPANLKILFDNSVKDLRNFICGANEVDNHFKNVNWGRDCALGELSDLCLAKEGDHVLLSNGQAGSGRLKSTRGIEVGHIFKLGTKYSEAMHAQFTDVQGKQRPFFMGCYGIGVSRIAAAAIEQNHDERGLRWPIEIAPWAVHLLCMNTKDDTQRNLAEQLYEALQNSEIETLFDDREQSAGSKFNDADLLGMPLCIVVGRNAKEGKVELRYRDARQGPMVLDMAECVHHVAREVAQRLHN